MAQPTYSFPDYWGEADLDVLPDDGHRYEIVDGSLLVTPPPLDGHQGIGANLLMMLRGAMPSGWRVLYEIGVRVPGGNFIPDVVVLKPGSARNVEWRESADVALVVEIASKPTHVTDRTLKAAKYADAGIPAYWRVGGDGTVTMHTAPEDGEYTRAQVVRPGETIRVDHPFPVDVVPDALVD